MRRNGRTPGTAGMIRKVRIKSCLLMEIEANLTALETGWKMEMIKGPFRAGKYGGGKFRLPSLQEPLFCWRSFLAPWPEARCFSCTRARRLIGLSWIRRGMVKRRGWRIPRPAARTFLTLSKAQTRKKPQGRREARGRRRPPRILPENFRKEA